MRFLVYKDVKGEFRWRLYAANNRILADSGEGYNRKQDCIDAINLVAACNGVPILFV